MDIQSPTSREYFKRMPDQLVLSDIASLKASLAKQKRGQLRALVAIVLLGVMLTSSLTYTWIQQHSAPWNPIAVPAKQQVLNPKRILGVTAELNVIGTKCFKQLPLWVQGQQTWKSVSPPGLLVTTALTKRLFDPKHPRPGDVWSGNCVTKRYTNSLDPQVQDYFLHHNATVWMLTGTMSPKRCESCPPSGVTQIWDTDEVTITR